MFDIWLKSVFSPVIVTVRLSPGLALSGSIEVRFWLKVVPINKIGNNRTVLIITHRLSTVEDADIIFFLDKGKIIERHSWCRSTNKNSAGFFLVWYQIYKNKIGIKRSNWKAEKTRQDAKDFCQRMETSKRVLKKSEILDNFNQTF